MLTAQQVFDRVWDHFVVQRQQRSVDYTGQCLYRGPEGTKCAVGIFIADEAYDRGLEQTSVIDFMDALRDHDRFKDHKWAQTVRELFAAPERQELREFLTTHQELLISLQTAHDGSQGSFVNQDRLRAVAYHYNLEVPS